MPHATQVITIHAPVDAIWQVISDFGAGANYLAMVTNCSVQGSGIGALRTLTYQDGSVIIERLDMIDESTHCLSYTLVTDTPFGNCMTTMALHVLSPDKAELNWTTDFQSTSFPANEAVALMEGMLADNSQMLKQFVEH